MDRRAIDPRQLTSRQLRFALHRRQLTPPAGAAERAPPTVSAEMSGSFRLVQLTDSHIGAGWSDVDPAATLRQVICDIRRITDRPDAVLVTGDLVEHGDPAEYAVVQKLASELGAPVLALPGNHDDRDTLRRCFGLGGTAGEPVQYSVDLGSLRLVALDTTRPGRDDGELSPERLRWLDAELALAPEQMTLLAMHHPPFAIGIPVWDAIGLPADDRRALADVVRRHPQVRRMVAGHVHQSMTGAVAGRVAITVPSTYMQARLDLNGAALEFGETPPGFALHTVTDGEIISHVLAAGPLRG
jgi:3',5'-cyclic AMP phosphodiesterase CpdA